MGSRSGGATPRPISVAHIDTGSAFRGGQEALLRLNQTLRERGLLQHVFAPEGSVLMNRVSAVGVPASPLGGLSDLRRRLRGFDLIHSHSGRAQNIAFCATVGLPVRRVASRHVAFEPNHPQIHRLKYTLTCHGIIAVSEAVRRTLLNAGVPTERIEVIPTGIDWPAEPPSEAQRVQARAHWGFGPEDFVVGHLGAFTREKGQDVAVEAARRLASRIPGLRMILAGEGPERASLAATAGIVFPGQVDREELLPALDLFIMPSRSEAWGLAALEAMAHGIPVIASKVGGLPEMIEESETGWLVAPGDPIALAEAIERAAADRGLLHATGEKARERARRFSIEKTAEKVDLFYRRLLRR